MNILLAILAVILLFIVYSFYITTQKIKYRRQKGVDLRKKNIYYRFVAKAFLKKLPA